MTTITKEKTNVIALMVDFLAPRARKKTSSFTLTGSTIDEAKIKLKAFISNNPMKIKKIVKIKESPATKTDYGMIMMDFYNPLRRTWNDLELETFLKI